LVLPSLVPTHHVGNAVPVKHIEGVSHGFIVLHAQDGRTLATGDMIQTVEGERVTSEVVLHFKDGSVHDEVTFFLKIMNSDSSRTTSSNTAHLFPTHSMYTLT
jgi:hypothetical protein